MYPHYGIKGLKAPGLREPLVFDKVQTLPQTKYSRASKTQVTFLQHQRLIHINQTFSYIHLFVGMARRIRYYGRQTELVKRRPGSDIPMLIDLPTHTGAIPQKLLRQHLPKFFNDLRESGNRIASPQELFSPSFQRWNDYGVYSFALDWVFDRVELYDQYPRALFHPVYNNVDPANQMARLLQVINTAFATNDLNTFYAMVSETLDIIRAISEIIRPDRGFDYSFRLFKEYVQTVEVFIPHINNFDPSMGAMMEVLQAIWNAGQQDLTPIEQLARGMSLNEQIQLHNLITLQIPNQSILAFEMRAASIPF